VRCVLGTFGRIVLELGESLRNIAEHGHIDGACAVSIVPIKGETAVTVAGPFGGDGVEGVEGLKGGGEMFGVFAAGVSDSEIIDNPSKEGRTSSMGEET
jgi:hypothetical protein